MPLSPSLITLIETFPQGELLLTRVQSYMDELLKWNRRINLVSRKEGDLSPHFEDSLWFAKHLPEGAQVMDVGSGGGFPGMVTQVARPDCRVTLFEPVHKKVAFLQRIRSMLAPEAVVHCERVEPVWARGCFEHAVCKAFTDLPAWEALVGDKAKVLWFLASQKQAEARASDWEIVHTWSHELHGERFLLRKQT